MRFKLELHPFGDLLKLFVAEFEVAHLVALQQHEPLEPADFRALHPELSEQHGVVQEEVDI